MASKMRWAAVIGVCILVIMSIFALDQYVDPPANNSPTIPSLTYKQEKSTAANNSFKITVEDVSSTIRLGDVTLRVLSTESSGMQEGSEDWIWTGTNFNVTFINGNDLRNLDRGDVLWITFTGVSDDEVRLDYWSKMYNAPMATADIELK